MMLKLTTYNNFIVVVAGENIFSYFLELLKIYRVLPWQMSQRILP